VPFRWKLILVAVVAATLLVSVIESAGLLERLELDAFDALVRSTPDRGPDDRLLIVAVTEEEKERFGYPLRDETLARAIAEIRRHDPRAVGVDLYRNIDFPPGERLLAEQFEAPEVVGIRYVGTGPERGQVPAPPALAPDQIGFSDLVIDPDGVLRRALLYVGGNPGHYSFALRTVLVGLGSQNIDFRAGEDALRFGPNAIPRLRAHAGGYADADDSGYQTLLRFTSRRQPAEIVTVGALLDGYVRPEAIDSRIVLIGDTDSSLPGQFFTPYSAELTDADFSMSAVLIHAQIISQLLDVVDGNPALFSLLSRPGEVAWLIVWAVLAAVFMCWVRYPPLSLLFLPLVPAAIAVIGWLSVSGLFWPPLIAPAVAAAFAGLVVIAGRYLFRTTHDSITGLPSRREFMKRMGAALRDDRPDFEVAVAVLDIDRFQVVNKAVGHDAGEELLARVSDRLRQWIGDERDLARLGGDEFAVFFRGEPRARVEQRLQDLRRKLVEPLVLGQHALSITASVGVAFACKHYDREPDKLLRGAHTAMHRAKARNEVQLEVFAPEMADEARARLDLESDLVDAVRDRSFFLNYQPVIDLRTGCVHGFEALLRWECPVRGRVDPSEFIPILEETGLIVPLGQWLLETATRQAAEWRATFPHLELVMSVNLSGRQINEPGLIDIVQQALSTSGLASRGLQLEFTESMIMRDVESTHQLMSDLRSAGVSLAIDDFGTGYSSLSYLHRFPVDILKIDRAFVENLADHGEDHNIVHTIIALGQRLNMTLVAEGIESQRQAEMLRQAGCQFAQGFLFSTPLSVVDATDWLEAQANG
jgi:diguanylate cyclase (GGDEF)-like protein